MDIKYSINQELFLWKWRQDKMDKDVQEKIAQLQMIEQNNAALQNQEVVLQSLQARLDEAVSRNEATGADFGSFKTRMSTSIEKLKKQSQVLLLNNRDFIQMFESIQDDFDELRRKGVLIAYKADAGTV